MTCNCKLPNLVESHDLVGLQKAIEDPNLTCSTYPCHFQPGLNKLILDNQSVVERACVLGHLDMLEMFLRNGCSANLPTSHGRLIHTLLTSLKSNRHLIDSGAALHIVKLLMVLDCDVNVKDYKGMSPLMLASELADPRIMKEILDRCLDWQLSSPNKDNGHTPLHMACMNGSVECVCLLLGRLSRKSIDVCDMKYYTPLRCSFMVLKNNLAFHQKNEKQDERLLRVQYSHMAIIELLLNAGASPSKGHIVPTALDTAQEYESKREVYRYHTCGSASSILDNCPACSRLKKLQSPYAELVRMLIGAHNVNPFEQREYVTWTDLCPQIQGLLHELYEYMDMKHQKEGVPPSLMDQARRALRLHVARCDNLSALEQLPLPRKLKDFVRFVDF